MVLGNSMVCGLTTTRCRVAITSTTGGYVVTPGEATHTYNATQVIDLVAVSDADYHFVNWTGNGSTIGDAEDGTTITMNGDYSITANFGLAMTFTDKGPDTSRPPSQNLTTTIPTDYCAPMSMVNIPMSAILWIPTIPMDLDIGFLDPETEEMIFVFARGDRVSSSEDHQENWNLEYGEECIGHAVTGVGYILDWDPADSGPANYVIVHDNWAGTPENIDIPWSFWNSSHPADPGS